MKRSLDSKIWAIAWPAILANLSIPLLGLVDAALLGHLDSPVFLGAVAIGGALVGLPVLVCLVVAGGVLGSGRRGICSTFRFERTSSHGRIQCGRPGSLLCPPPLIGVRFLAPDFTRREALRAASAIIFKCV